jgi:hypothetical protein
MQEKKEYAKPVLEAVPLFKDVTLTRAVSV